MRLFIAMTHSSLRFSLLAGMTALLLAACGSQPTRNAHTNENADQKPSASDATLAHKVGQRAVERWDYLIKREAEKAYDYLSPGFRATKKRADYANEMNNRPIRWTKVYLHSEVCEKPDVCKIILMIEYEAVLPGTSKPTSAPAFINETWIKDGGKWWLLPGDVAKQTKN